MQVVVDAGGQLMQVVSCCRWSIDADGHLMQVVI